MSKILTVCRAGLVRSVGMADVLKAHFEPVDVLPCGHAECFQSDETLMMLLNWADQIIVMEAHYKDRLEERLKINLGEYVTVHVCDVGPDVYGATTEGKRQLIDKCWRWLRAHYKELGITEHTKRL